MTHSRWVTRPIFYLYNKFLFWIVVLRFYKTSGLRYLEVFGSWILMRFAVFSCYSMWCLYLIVCGFAVLVSPYAPLNTDEVPFSALLALYPVLKIRISAKPQQALRPPQYCVGFCDSINDTDWKCPLCVAEDHVQLRLESLLYRDVSIVSKFQGLKHIWLHVYPPGKGYLTPTFGPWTENLTWK